MDTTLAQAFPRCVKKYYNIYTRERKALGKGCPKYFGTCRKKVRQIQRKWLGPAFPTGILAFSTACRKRNLLNKRWEGRSVFLGAAGAQSAHKGPGDHRAPALWFDSQGPKALGRQTPPPWQPSFFRQSKVKRTCIYPLKLFPNKTSKPFPMRGLPAQKTGNPNNFSVRLHPLFKSG